MSGLVPLLHVGLHKTGTTFLQRNLFFRPELGYQQVWDRSEIAERLILTHPMKFDPAAHRAAFEAAHDGRSAPVVSHEALSGVPNAGLYHGFEVADRLKRVFPEARVVIGVREQAAMIRSLYGQYVVRGGDLDLRAYLGLDINRPGFRPLCRLEHFEYDLIVRRYRELYGPGNVLVLPLELLRADPRRYLDALATLSGAAAGDVAAMPLRNVGRGALTMEMERRLNRFIRPDRARHATYAELPAGTRLKNRAIRLIDRALPRRAHAARDKALRRLIADATDGVFVQSNRRLAAFTDAPLGELGYAI